MAGHRRLRTLATVAGLVLALGLAVGSTAPSALAAPTEWRFDGGGYGHGIGMSQYGAYGMARRGVSAGRIISFYYGGAAARPAALPATLRVGLLQAGRDPSTGGRLDRVLIRGAEVAGRGGTGLLLVAGVAASGRVHRRYLVGHVTWSIRPEAGGTSVYDPFGRRAFGPTRRGAGVVVHHQLGASQPARLLLPQTGQQLRWGRLEVDPVTDERGVGRLRAVTVLPVNGYLRGLGEMPASWGMEALKAQAIAARGYAVYAAATRGQHAAAGSWNGCDCAVYGDVRDQFYAGYAKESGADGSRWVTAVLATGSLVVRAGTRLVQAFYSSSSGGYTSSNAQWGSAPRPEFPSRPDPDDRAGGRNPNHRWTVRLTAATVADRLRGYGVGTVLAMTETRVASWGYRVATVKVRGSEKTVTLTGAQLRAALGLKSTKFLISP
jgi:stage II sporulation protein D